MCDTIEGIKVGACPVCGSAETSVKRDLILYIHCHSCNFTIDKSENITELVKIWNHLSVDQDYYEEERSKQE